VNYLNSRKGNNKPFFLYLPFQNVHEPFQVPQKYKDLYPKLRGAELTLCGMISCLDDMIGEIVKTLNDTTLMSNTVLIFTSDNGAPRSGEQNEPYRNYPLRGYKTSLWEGGTKVPAFVYSPLLPKPGITSNELFHVTDWLPTLVSLAGGSTTRNKPLDGFNIWPSITTGSPSPRTELLYNINPLCNAGQAGKPKAAVRVGQWKLLTECYNATSKAPEGIHYLFNLETDPFEKNNVAPNRPGIVQQLVEKLASYADGMVPPMQWVPPYQGPNYFCYNCPLGVPSEPYHAWRPWLKI